MKNVMGYGFGIGFNPFTGEVKVVKMRADVDENGKIEFFMEDEKESFTPKKEQESKPKEKVVYCDNCDDKANDARKFYVREGSHDFEGEAMVLCDSCKYDLRGMLKLA